MVGGASGQELANHLHILPMGLNPNVLNKLERLADTISFAQRPINLINVHVAPPLIQLSIISIKACPNNDVPEAFEKPI